VVGAIGFVKGFFICFYGNLAYAGDGVPGVDAEVSKELVNLRRIDLDKFEVSAGLPEEVDILTDQSAKHIEHSLHRLI
jgi:hypothetical protein